MRDPFLTHRIFFFGMVAILALILVWQFTRAILLAVALVILLIPVDNWLLKIRGVNGRQSFATAVTILVFILIIANPAFLVIAGAITQAASLFSGLDFEGLHFSLQDIKEGGIDLIELWLKSDEKQAEQNIGQMALTAVKNISTCLRKDPQIIYNSVHNYLPLS